MVSVMKESSKKPHCMSDRKEKCVLLVNLIKGKQAIRNSHWSVNKVWTTRRSVRFERRSYWRELFVDSTRNNRFFGTELGMLKSVTADGGKNKCCSRIGAIGQICKKWCTLAPELRWFFTERSTRRQYAANFCHWRTLRTVISTQKYIRRNCLTHRQFHDFLKEINTWYGDFYYSTIGWLNRGAVGEFFYLHSGQ